MIEVVVGIIEDDEGRILVNRRRAGTHLAGAWEFPGGKRKPQESPLAALERELNEELAIDLEAAVPFMELEHRYPDRHVRLDVWCVERFSGTAVGAEGQEIRWVALEELGSLGILEADEPILTALRSRPVSSAKD
jgi:8-oxo-dGTP diphosphatase